MNLGAAEYQSKESARSFLEARRWPDGPICPHCGRFPVAKLDRENSTSTHGREGLHQCRGCRKQFTVTVGTIFEDSHIPLNKWLLAIHLMCSSKKGVSALQLQRDLELGSYRTAWFMCRRIRWAQKETGTGDKGVSLIAGEKAAGLLLSVKPSAGMPRPAAHRRKSIVAEANDEAG